MSYSYGSIEVAGSLKAGTFVQATTYGKAGTYLEATTYVKAGTTMKAVGGLALKTYIVKCPTTATSVAVTGISAAMLLQDAVAYRMSTGGIKLQSFARMTTAMTLGAAKVIFLAAKGFSNCPVHVLVHDPR